MNCGVGHRHSSDPALLWLWCRPAATSQIKPLAWEPPYAVGAAPKKTERKKEKNSEFSCMDGNNNNKMSVLSARLD